jgi:hypothetical protein
MGVIEGLFEKFEKGEIRLAERTAEISEVNDDGTLDITISDLISVEDVVCVLVSTDAVDADDPTYESVAETTASNTVIAGEGSLEEGTEDNVVTVQFKSTLGDTTTGVENTDGTSDTIAPNLLKVVARGY